MKLTEQAQYVRDFVSEFKTVGLIQMQTLLYKSYGIEREAAKYLISSLCKKQLVHFDETGEYLLPGDNRSGAEVKLSAVKQLWIPILLCQTKLDCQSIKKMRMRAGDVLFVADNKTCQLVLADVNNLTETKELLGAAEREKRRIEKFKDESVQSMIPRVYVLFDSTVTKEKAQFIAESFEFDAYFSVFRVRNENIGETFQYQIIKKFD